MADTSNKFQLAVVPPRKPGQEASYRFRQSVGIMTRADLVNLVAWACALADITAYDLGPILADIRGGTTGPGKGGGS